jgi:triosephosphate isomerase (TIM)
MSRKKFLAGNWKMQKTRGEASEFFQAFTRLVGNLGDVTRDVDLAFGVSATLFDAAIKSTTGSGVKILAQNVHFEKQGAFTGELSTGMLVDAGVSGSIIGHSERRQYFAENDEAVGKKWNALALSSLLPVVCVGETKSEREAGKTNDVVTRQLDAALAQVNPEARAKEFVVAYEPVWAIGTGLTATPEQAEDVHKMIRGLLEKHFGKSRADATRIIYGGSMNAANCAELLQKQNIDGGLVGGASLKPEDFSKMVECAKNG